MGDEAIDSTYTTATLTKTPTWYSGMSANVNYARKTDNKGSMFFADIDYRYSFPKEYRDYSFEKNSQKESLYSGYTQKYRTYFEGYGLWLRYNANVSGKTSFYNNVNVVLGHSHFDEKYFGMYNLHNIANIRDYTLNASSSYVQRWTNKFSTTLQLTFKALWQRKESADETSVFNRMFFVVPNLKIAYNPSNKHYLSMSLYKSVYAPSYFEMDPMKSFTSPSTYKVGNPYLDVGKNYGVDLNYSFMNNYGLSVYMNKIKNVGTDYTVTDGKGNTVITHLNGVNMNEISVSLYGGVYLFDDYLYFSPTFYWAFFRFSNWMNGTRNVNYGRWLNIQPRLNVTLSKKQRIFLYARFDYSSKTQSSNYVRPEDMSISLSLTKNFNNSSLSISASSSLKKYYYIYNETPNFGFNTQTRNYPSIDITYSLTFGNKNVRDVQQRSNAELRGRFGN